MRQALVLPSAGKLEWNRSANPTRHAPARCREGETWPCGANPGLKTAAGLFRVLSLKSRPNLGLLVLGQASWLCSQSPGRSGFLMIINPRKYSQTRNTAILSGGIFRIRKIALLYRRDGSPVTQPTSGIRRESGGRPDMARCAL